MTAIWRLMALAALDQLHALQLRLAQVEAQREALRQELQRYCARQVQP